MLEKRKKRYEMVDLEILPEHWQTELHLRTVERDEEINNTQANRI
jgi:hypothetical protein